MDVAVFCYTSELLLRENTVTIFFFFLGKKKSPSPNILMLLEQELLFSLTIYHRHCISYHWEIQCGISEDGANIGLYEALPLCNAMQLHRIWVTAKTQPTYLEICEMMSVIAWMVVLTWMLEFGKLICCIALHIPLVPLSADSWRALWAMPKWK